MIEEAEQMLTWIHVVYGFISPPGRHCDAAYGLMFYQRFFF